MKREDIEKAAKHYSSRDGGVTLQMEIYAFIGGVNWRINSVWHDANEPAEQIRTILILNKFGGIQINYTGKLTDWSEYARLRNIEKWCYKEDLLPTKENE